MNINWLPILGSIIGFKRTQKEIPKLAKYLGLSFQQSNYKDEIGIVSGNYKGQQVKINIDKQTIVVFLKQEKLFEHVRLDSARKDRERDQSLHFKSGNRYFDKCFKTKKAPRHVQKKIIGNKRFFESFTILYKMRWRFIEMYNNQLIIQYKGPGFSVNYTLGNNPLVAQSTAGFCYIPADYIRKILPVMVECANSL